MKFKLSLITILSTVTWMGCSNSKTSYTKPKHSNDPVEFTYTEDLVTELKEEPEENSSRSQNNKQIENLESNKMAEEKKEENVEEKILEKVLSGVNLEGSAEEEEIKYYLKQYLQESQKFLSLANSESFKRWVESGSDNSGVNLEGSVEEEILEKVLSEVNLEGRESFKKLVEKLAESSEDYRQRERAKNINSNPVPFFRITKVPTKLTVTNSNEKVSSNISKKGFFEDYSNNVSKRVEDYRQRERAKNINSNPAPGQ